MCKLIYWIYKTFWSGTCKFQSFHYNHYFTVHLIFTKIFIFGIIIQYITVLEASIFIEEVTINTNVAMVIENHNSYKKDPMKKFHQDSLEYIYNLVTIDLQCSFHNVLLFVNKFHIELISLYLLSQQFLVETLISNICIWLCAS